jgi:hypothetical protein
MLWSMSVARRMTLRTTVMMISGLGLVVLFAAADMPRLKNEAMLPQLVLMAPGTEILSDGPRGWTHPVVRSAPRLASGAIDTLPDSAKTTATLFKTFIATDVVRRDSGYVLNRVGLANAIAFEGREIVISPKGPKAAIDSLTTIQSIVLRELNSEMERGRLIARTPTFALLRSPAIVLVGGRHQAVDLHYAFSVNPQTGAQKTLCWGVMAGSTSAPREIIAMPSKASFDCALDVAVSRRIGPLPLTWSFAMTSLPPGKAMAVSESLGRVIPIVAAGQKPAADLEWALGAIKVNLSRK